MDGTFATSADLTRSAASSARTAGTCRPPAVGVGLAHVSMAAHPSSLVAFRNQLNAVRLRAFSLLWSVLSRNALRLLPGSSLSFGPPRRAALWTRCDRPAGGEWREVFPERARTYPPPFFCNDPRATFLHAGPPRWPAVGVAVIPGGRVLDEHGWAVGPNDTLLGEFCLWSTESRSRANHILRLRPARRLAGRTLNLCSAEASVNFYHYMLEAVGRYALVQRAGFAWSDIDHVILPRFRSPTTVEIESAIGVPTGKVIRMGRREQFVCEQLIQPSLPGTLAGAPPWVVAFYRELFPAGATTRRDRRLFFPRTGRRQPVRAAALEAQLREHGFEPVDPGRTPQLRDLLAEASHIVGVHGAALTNLVFCRPGTRVLEILPSDSAHHHNGFYFSTLCASAGLPYGAVVGRSRRHRLLASFPQTGADFDVDAAVVDAGVQALLELRPATVLSSAA